MSDFDLVIRNGRVLDGTGRPAFTADVGVKDGVIAAVGAGLGRGAEEIDAAGRYVTPGFVDIHTHYDGQITWDSRLAPSTSHGVTTVVTGNCGVGFAPCRPGDRGKLVKVMEGVEDIPGAVMDEGLPWNWETFPEYLDSLACRQFDADVAVQIPHSPIRVYVMGDRGAAHEASTPEDRAAMARLVTEAVKAGAVGVSTSRSFNHRAKDGQLAPSVQTADEEVLALAHGLGEAKAGVFQIITETSAPAEQEMGLVRRIAEVSGRPVSFSLIQAAERPELWRDLIAGMDAANTAGCQLRAQISPRPVGVLTGLTLSYNPLSTYPSYRAIADRPLAERVAALRDPQFKVRLLAEQPIEDPVPLANRLREGVGGMFLLGPSPNYAPSPDMRIDNRAAAAGVTPIAMAYDLLLEDEGRAILCQPSMNFVGGSLQAARDMMVHPETVIALGDGGAHVGILCDASYPTHLLTYWTRDADPAWRFPIEWAVEALTRRPAEAVGLNDRGVVAPGFKADLNVIDHDQLRLHPPVPSYSLPAGGLRLMQGADGYLATVVSGQVTYRQGAATGALPGKLVRAKPGAAA